MSSYIKTGLITGAIVGGCTVAGAVAFPLALTAVGFGSTGVAAGSLAALTQTPHIAAGSAFAIAQSVGATGAGTLIGAKIGVVAGVGGDMLRRSVNYYY